MSTRLKKKLVNLGVDPSSARVNESFCLIGTPLPPLEKSKDSGEFVPLWKQDVRDEQGRRRLHGAFTGGFSAGYYNTVGSKEGWTPSTFLSSRSDRAKQKVSRPEDFMDEEDISEMKERQSLIDTTDEMDISGASRVGINTPGEELENDSVASALEASMLPPPRDSVGARILKKMGWRIGQGIGPRLTWRQRKLQDLQASFGQDDPSNDIRDDEEANKHTYAPRDTPIMLVDRKNNSHGLGYSPGMSLDESLGVGTRKTASGPKLAAGFGLGALNDAEDDDIDVYDGNHKGSSSRVVYDASDRADETRTGISRKSGQQSSRVPETKSTLSMQTFRDGTPVIPGFTRSDKPVAEDRWFPIPDVPKGWTPNPTRVWEKEKENTQNAMVPPPPLSHAQWKTGKSAEERGSILGETPLPAAPRSVFEYLSQKDRERLKNVTSMMTPSAPVSSPSGPGGPTPSKPIVAPTVPHIAQAALRGFQPFPTDPAKQARYNAYLHSQATPDSSTPPVPLPDQSVDEFSKEMEGYAKAALLFKPMSGAMASRFTSAAVVELGPNIQEGLHMPSASDQASENPPVKEAEKKADEHPKEHAARMGMYGPLTREVKVWQPARLLCKRFGVKDPNPEPEPELESTTATPSWQAPAETSAETSGATASSSDAPHVALEGLRSGHRDLANVGLGEDEDQGRDTLSYVRPAMDIFKAIFASDEEDSDGEDEEAKNDESDTEKVVATTKAPPSAITASPSLPANISESVDLGTFKPTFIPRSERDGKPKEKKEKKSKNGPAALVSFELEEESGNAASVPREKGKERPKKKKKREKQKEQADEDHAMWLEKPSSGELPLPPPPDVLPIANVESSPTKGRKRAIDFM